MPAATRRVVDAAAAAGLAIAVARFPAGTRTAADAAAAIGCDIAAIAKSIVLTSAAGPVLVLTSGANQADPDRVAAALGTTGVRRADPDEARAATGLSTGAEVAEGGSAIGAQVAEGGSAIGAQVAEGGSAVNCGTAPFGHPVPMPVLCDADLLDFDQVWAAAGTADTVFPISPADLVRISGATVAAVARPQGAPTLP